MKSIDLSTLPQGYIETASVLLNQSLKRRLSAGAAFTPSIIKKQDKITRGQRVSILAKAGSMEVRMVGKALSAGAVGDRIYVMNLKSKKRREGVINEKGDVVIRL